MIAQRATSRTRPGTLACPLPNSLGREERFNRVGERLLIHADARIGDRTANISASPMRPRGPNPVMEGGWSPERLVILEFPSRDHAEALLADPDVQHLFARRHRATTSRLVLVEGEP